MTRLGLLLSIVVLSSIGDLCAAQSFHTAKAQSPPAGTMFVYPERIPLQDGGMFTAQRGLMFVPLNRAKSNTDVIAVEVYHFPRSAEADPDTPPLFILHGGPGFEGLEEGLKQPGNFEQRIQRYLAISDVVVVGQRGIGSSKPNTMIELTVNPAKIIEADDEQQAIEEFQGNLASERQFWLDQGVDLQGFTVLEAAADVRDVAGALGYEKIMILGGSFGSHWGMAILRQHPEIVERAVLNAMEGPDHTWDHPGWYWNAFKRVAEEAEQDERLKRMIPEGGLVKAVETLVQKAQREPFTVVLDEDSSDPKEVLINGRVMQLLARGYTGNLHNWPAEVITMHNGDFTNAARQVLARTGGSGGRNFMTASYWMLDSASGISAKRRAEFEADPAVDIIGDTYWWYAAGSPVWEADLGDEFRQNFETDIPTVIVHGTWDTSTPYENAQELSPFFKNSKFVTVKRGSHGAMGEALNRSPEFREAITQFMITGDMSQLPDDVELPEPRWKVPEIAQAAR